MQSYKVTVNGRVFEVTVEETGQGQSPETPVTQQVPPAQATQAAPAAAASSTVAEKASSDPGTPAPAAVGAGETPIEAPLSGTILSVLVKTGDAVKPGQVLLTLEALKMENEIVTPTAGIVKGIFVQSGDAVSVGDIMLIIGSM